MSLYDEVYINQADVKIYRYHYCQDTHQTYKGIARCLWPGVDLTGTGPWAVLDRHRVHGVPVFYVDLFNRRTDAEDRYRTLVTQGRCSENCVPEAFRLIILSTPKAFVSTITP